MDGVRSVKTVVMTLVALSTLARLASAQVTGSLGGTVKDPQGGVIPGATITLINEAQSTTSTPVVTNDTGDFVFPNIPVGTYTVRVEMPSFKALNRSGVSVNAGTRTTLGTLVLEVGGVQDAIEVKAEAPLIQATSGDRSFTVTTTSVENLPLASRSFTALASLAPGVSGNDRIGGGGGRNITMDGVSTMDTGSNSILLQMNVESIAEV
jgi:hypothetical protein